MVLPHLKPFVVTQFATTIDDIEVPEDIRAYIKQGANIARYKLKDNNYDHIYHDFVDEHTKRMVLYASSLSLSEALHEEVIRTLWIHDIPEILDSQLAGSDITSIDKIRHPELALASNDREEAVMRAIFSPPDIARILAFEPVKHMFFAKKIETSLTTPAGVLSKLIDVFVDGVNSFHGFMTEYLTGASYDPALPINGWDVFDYGFHRVLDAYEAISGLSDPIYEEVRTMGLEILRKDAIGYIDMVWTDEAIARLPSYAKEVVESYQKRRKTLFNYELKITN